MPIPNGHFTTCCQCQSKMWLPASLYEAAMAGREKITFYCAYGHSQHFLTGESDETRLRRERDRAVQEKARLEDELRSTNRLWQHAMEEARKAKREKAKIAKRVANGVCPDCNRTFANLARHMHSKHPKFSATETKNAENDLERLAV